jgi:4-amino-4-deoxy-L-arabinose transferase-like glycosyltransferase
MHPQLNVMDYYGYRELARNIFQRLDFTVRWELDALLRYPPLFPMLAHLVTFVTGDFVRSIQYLNMFSASFCLVPLFLLVRKILNTYSAVLAVVFSLCYFGLRPCYDLRSDQFFCLLVITICWYLWTILNDKEQRNWKYFIAGLLISLAYLTKHSGLLFCLFGSASIFYWFSRQKDGRKKAATSVAFLFLGATPLVVGYHLLVLHSSRNATVLSDSAYTFFDGNAIYEGGQQFRERTMRELDPAGREFSYISFLKKNSTLSFIIQHPGFMFRKCIWGMKLVARMIVLRAFSLANTASGALIVGLGSVFLLLVAAGGLPFRSRPGFVHVLLFASTIALFPLVHVYDERYIMPFMPFYFVLALFGVNAVCGSIGPRIKSRLFRTSLGVAFFVLLCFVYVKNGSSGARHDYAASTAPGQYDEFVQTASWIRNDARHAAKRIKIMSRYTAISYLADSEFIILPYTLDWDKIIDFAVSRNVDYIVIDQAYLSRFRPDQWNYFKNATVPRAHVQMIAGSKVNDNLIWILKLSGRTAEPTGSGG